MSSFPLFQKISLVKQKQEGLQHKRLVIKSSFIIFESTKLVEQHNMNFPSVLENKELVLVNQLKQLSSEKLSPGTKESRLIVLCENFPESTKPLISLGKHYLFHKEADKAIDVFEKALALDRKNAYVYETLIELSLQQEKFEKVFRFSKGYISYLNYLNRAAKDDPQYQAQIKSIIDMRIRLNADIKNQLAHRQNLQLVLSFGKADRFVFENLYQTEVARKDYLQTFGLIASVLERGEQFVRDVLGPTVEKVLGAHLLLCIRFQRLPDLCRTISFQSKICRHNVSTEFRGCLALSHFLLGNFEQGVDNFVLFLNDSVLSATPATYRTLLLDIFAVPLKLGSKSLAASVLDCVEKHKRFAFFQENRVRLALFYLTCFCEDRKITAQLLANFQPDAYLLRGYFSVFRAYFAAEQFEQLLETCLEMHSLTEMLEECASETEFSLTLLDEFFKTNDLPCDFLASASFLNRATNAFSYCQEVAKALVEWIYNNLEPFLAQTTHKHFGRFFDLLFGRVLLNIVAQNEDGLFVKKVYTLAHVPRALKNKARTHLFALHNLFRQKDFVLSFFVRVSKLENNERVFSKVFLLFDLAFFSAKNDFAVPAKPHLFYLVRLLCLYLKAGDAVSAKYGVNRLMGLRTNSSVAIGRLIKLSVENCKKFVFRPLVIDRAILASPSKVFYYVLYLTLKTKLVYNGTLERLQLAQSVYSPEPLLSLAVGVVRMMTALNRKREFDGKTALLGISSILESFPEERTGFAENYTLGKVFEDLGLSALSLQFYNKAFLQLLKQKTLPDTVKKEYWEELHKKLS